MNHSGEAKMIVALRSILPAVMLACIGAGQTAAQPVCKPALTVEQVGFSEMINLRRVWDPALSGEAPRCTTTRRVYPVGVPRPSSKTPQWCFPHPSILPQG